MKVLLLEDDLIEQARFIKTVEQLDITLDLFVAGSGIEAMKHLKESEELPDFILMDLNMPDQNGLEFLSELKANLDFSTIPTIAFTTSNDPQDIRKCYQNGIASYIIKPTLAAQYKDTIYGIFNYWKINLNKK